MLIRVVRWALPTPCTVTRFQSGLEPLEVVFLSRQPSEVKTCQYSLTVAKRARTRPSVVRLRRLSNPALAQEAVRTHTWNTATDWVPRGHLLDGWLNVQSGTGK